MTEVDKGLLTCNLDENYGISTSTPLYPPPAGDTQSRVQTGKIVYKTDRGHGLHFTARRRFYAVESDKPNGHKDSTC